MTLVIATNQKQQISAFAFEMISHDTARILDISAPFFGGAAFGLPERCQISQQWIAHTNVSTSVPSLWIHVRSHRRTPHDSTLTTCPAMSTGTTLSIRSTGEDYNNTPTSSRSQAHLVSSSSKSNGLLRCKASGHRPT